LNTLGELAIALKEHENEYDALLETIGNKASQADLENYYNKTEVDTLIDNIELIPGQTGEKGEDGKSAYQI
jgi:hypothetical protein